MWWFILAAATAAATAAAAAALLLAVCAAVFAVVTRARLHTTSSNSIAFFHPYAHAGGGGERVLWVAMAETMAVSPPSTRVLLYTGIDFDTGPDADAGDVLVARAAARFNVSLPRPPIVVPLTSRNILNPPAWARPTMVAQSLASMLVAVEAAARAPAATVIDSMGYAFTYPVFAWLAGSVVAAYVHYPTISTDMLDAVVQRRPSYNNGARIAGSVVLSSAKVLYYKAFAAAYGWVGSLASVVAVNSSWTHGHIASLWACPDTVLRIMYPPCDASTFLDLPPPSHPSRSLDIVSVGQFRPEKDHALQIHAFAAARAVPGFPHQARLILIGSVRDEHDRARVRDLQALAAELAVADAVEFRIDVPFPKLVAALGASTVGLHTMWNEHFGIAVVEYMAAGLITLAHGTAGPRMDIVGEPADRRGYLATSAAEFAEKLVWIYAHLDEARAVAAHGRASVSRFSDDVFRAAFARLLHDLPS